MFVFVAFGFLQFDLLANVLGMGKHDVEASTADMRMYQYMFLYHQSLNIYLSASTRHVHVHVSKTVYM